MLNGTVGHVMKSSLLCSYVLSQPLAVYVDAYPVQDNKALMEAEQVQYSEHGQVVRIVQQKLQTLSYHDDKVNREYNVLTESALRNYQKERGVDVSRKAEETKKELIPNEKQKHVDTLKNVSASVHPGMHNNDVKMIQKSLQYFGYYEGQIDGIYGPLTKKGLEIAEEEHGISLIEEVTEKNSGQLYDTEEGKEEKTKESPEKDKVESNTATTAGKQETEKETAQAKPDEDVKEVKTKTNVNTSVVDVAQSLIGTPYVWGGRTTGGFDCSGFIQYIYESQDITVPRTVSDTWNFANAVEQPSVGDLVFFETYKPGPSHMGVYIGNGQFIHAGESRGVEVSELDMSYWQDRYIGAKRIQ